MGSPKTDHIRSICKHHRVGLLYLFGSKNTTALTILKDGLVEISDPMTDADVGVVFLFDLFEHTKHYLLYSTLYNQLEDLFNPFQLDLVFLQECHSVFQFEAIKGICVYKKSQEIQDQFEMNVLRRLPDFKYVLEQYEKEILEQY